MHHLTNKPRPSFYRYVFLLTTISYYPEDLEVEAESSTKTLINNIEIAELSPHYLKSPALFSKLYNPTGVYIKHTAPYVWYRSRRKVVIIDKK